MVPPGPRWVQTVPMGYSLLATLVNVFSNSRSVPSRFVLEFDWRSLRLDEDTWSGSKVNQLIGEFLGQALRQLIPSPIMLQIDTVI